MQKSLFKKYLLISVSVILVSFLLLGIMLIVFVSDYWQKDKQTLLDKNVRGITSLAPSYLDSYITGGLMLRPEFKAVLSLFSDSINSDIFLSDVNGNILLTSDQASTATEGAVVPESILNSAIDGSYAGTTNLGGIYGRPCYVVARPVVMNLNARDQTVAVVFAAYDASSLGDFRGDMLKMFLFAAIGAFAIAFCAVGLFTYGMVRPLREMATAARCFGAGDFTRRVPVTTQDEIGQLAVAFNNMAASLSSSESTRRSFIANVSHELKTPMTTIAGFIDGILDGTIPPDKQQHYLKIVSDEVKRLSRLVKTMLDLSRIDNGELHMNKTRFDLTNTVLSALLTFEKKIDERHLEIHGLEHAESQFIDGDPDMIHQVVYNLIENAVKFTNEGGYIEIHVEDRPDRNIVTIKNSGQGIPADEIGFIFDKFYKTDKSRSQDKNGMGLGLYIVRTIVKQHGGDIAVSSVVGEYCQFQFWIPKVTAELAKPELKG